jgi:hypothetical protein
VLGTEARTGDLVHELREGSLDGVLLALEADIGDLEYDVIGRAPFVPAASPVIRSSNAGIGNAPIARQSGRDHTCERAGKAGVVS